MTNLSRLCLGTAALGMAYPPGSRSRRPTHAESAEMLRYAWDAGIRDYDTARAYGDAEELCCACLSRQASIVTKIAPELALQALMNPRISTWLIHNPRREYLTQKVARMAYRGASVYTPAEARAAIRAGLKIIQIPYHILNQSHAKAGVFEAAKAAGVTVYARQPFARGEALRQGFTAADCLRFALASPADYVVFGVTTLAQLEQDIAIAAAPFPADWPARYAALLACDAGLELASVCTVR